MDLDSDSPWAVDEADLSIVQANEWSKIESGFTNVCLARLTLSTIS